MVTKESFTYFKPAEPLTLFIYVTIKIPARRAGSHGNMSASDSAGPGFDPGRGSKFSFENFQPRG